jgi:Zn-dependent oligopeptidase
MITVAMFVYTLWAKSAFNRQHNKSRLDELWRRKNQLFKNYRNLNYKYYSGKYEDAEYSMQQALIEIEVSKVMTEFIDLQHDGSQIRFP